MGADSLIIWYTDNKRNGPGASQGAQSVRPGVWKSFDAGLLEEHMLHSERIGR